MEVQDAGRAHEPKVIGAKQMTLPAFDGASSRTWARGDNDDEQGHGAVAQQAACLFRLTGESSGYNKASQESWGVVKSSSSEVGKIL